jgi:hypothetical protein
VSCGAGPFGGYAARFDDLFGFFSAAAGVREYLAEPVAGAQHRSVQRLQFFLSESRWDPEQVSGRRLELLLADPATAPHAG